MAALAKGLPVCLIPEQFLIPPVRNDMIDYSRRGEPVLFHTFHAQRVQPKVSFPDCPPPGVIPAGIRTAAQPVAAPYDMIFAIDLTLLAKARTAGIAAGPSWFLGHFTPLSDDQ